MSSTVPRRKLNLEVLTIIVSVYYSTILDIFYYFIFIFTFTMKIIFNSDTYIYL